MHRPQTICILRLSALGDVTHVVPMIHTIHTAWPDTKITWIIGQLEAKLVRDLPGVEFIALNKKDGWRGFLALRSALKNRCFDVLLHCQVALRANCVSTLISAKRRIGFDRARSKDLHGLFINERIPARTNQHALEAIGSFVEPLGLKPEKPQWHIPIAEQDKEIAQQLLPGDQPTLIISPCSSHALRNWLPERYAAVADVAIREYGLRVAICGGRSAIERVMTDTIMRQMQEKPLNLVGKDTLKQFLALAQRAVVVLTPDSGPMHMANAVGTPVIGLHAASNPKRSGPYNSLQWCINKYDMAARRYKNKSANMLPWGTKLEYPQVMSLIETSEVLQQLEKLLQHQQLKS